MFTAPVVLSTVSVPIVFKDPNGTLVTTPTTFDMCEGPQDFRASGGQSYEFRINGFVVFTVNTGNPSLDASFDPLTNHVSAPYTLVTGDVVDVLVYDLPLTASSTIDANACSSRSEALTMNVAVPPNVLVTTSGTLNSYCPGSTVTFTIVNFPGVSSATTYEYIVTGQVTPTPIGTTKTFSVVMPVTNPGSVATITIEATDPFCSSSPVTTEVALSKNEITSAGTISITDNTICSGDIPTDIFETVAPVLTASGTISYQWYQRTISTTTWIAVGGARGKARDLNFAGFPLTQSTQFRRETISTFLGQNCGSEFSNTINVLINATIVPIFRTPDNVTVSGPTTFSMCSGPQDFYASGGRSYEFRINGAVFYTTSSTAPADIVTFDPLSDGVSSPYTFVSLDEVDVMVYDLPLTASNTIDPAACGYLSDTVTVTVFATPSVTINPLSLVNSYCPGETVSFTITLLGGTDPNTTFEWNVTGGGPFTSIGTNTTFSAIMPDLIAPTNIATITIRATSPSCPSTQIITTLEMEENDVEDAGTISSTDLTFCAGQDPANIFETVSPSFSITSSTITYQWYQRRINVPVLPWNAIATPRGFQRDLDFTSFPLTEDTQFVRETISTYLGTTCSEFTNVINYRVTTLLTPVFRTPDGVSVTTPTTYSMCEGPAEFQASGGMSYEFRINGFVAYTIGATNTTDVVTFDPLTNHVSAPYTLVSGDEVDVLVYNLPLTASLTIDPASCSEPSETVTVSVSRVPSVTINPLSLSNSFCPGETVTFTISLVPGADPNTTFEYNITGSGPFTSIGTNTTFNAIMPNLIAPVNTVTITVRATSSVCSGTPAISTLIMEENEVMDAGTISTSRLIICSGDDPDDIVEIVSPTFSTSSGTITYQWYQRSIAGPPTNPWLPIAAPRGEQQNLNFTSFPLTESTQFRRETISTHLLTSCSTFTLPISIQVLSTIVPELKTPDGALVTSATNYSMCAGPATFRSKNGLSYEFRINGSVVYTIGASNTTDVVTFDPLTNHVSAPYNLVSGDRVDVLVYNLALTASNTIDPTACSYTSSPVTIFVSATPSVTLSTVGSFNSYCPGDTVTFRIVPNPGTSSSTTFRYNVSGIATWTSLVTNTTFTVTMPNVVLPSTSATITVEATDPLCPLTPVLTSISLAENEIYTAGVISSTDLTVCSGDEPVDIIEITAPTTQYSSTIEYQWYQRATGVTLTWSTIAAPRGTARDLNFTGFPLTQNTTFRRETISRYLGEACGGSFTAPIDLRVEASIVPEFKTPDGALVTTPTTYSMCAGPATFRAKNGRSYEFRINGFVVYTVGATNTTDVVTFDPLTDHVSAPYTLVTNDRVDVVVYDLALTASNTIDPAACGYTSSAVTVTVSATPSVTLSTVGSFNSYCPGEAVTFRIVPNPGTSSLTTYRYGITGIATMTGLGTNTTFTVTLTGVSLPSRSTTITVEATDPACPGTPVLSTINLIENDVLTAGQISSTDLTICSGDEPTDIFEIVSPTFQTETGTIVTYQWYQRTTVPTGPWLPIGAPRGQNRDLNFSGFPVTQDTQFRRETIATLLGQTCGGEFTTPISLSIETAIVPDFRIAQSPGPDISVTTPTTYSICTGSNQVFRASQGRSYQFRINNVVVYTVSSTAPANFVSFDALTDHVSAPYVLTNGDEVDVIVYDLPLTASNTIDPAACGYPSSAVTITTVALPVPTISALNITNNTFCAGQTVDFRISLATPDPNATYQYDFTGNTAGLLSTPAGGTSTTFSIDFSITDNLNVSNHSTVTVYVSTPSCTTQGIGTIYLEENEITTSVVTLTSTDSSVCTGDNPGVITAVMPTATITGTVFTYQWQQRVPPSSAWVNISGSRGESDTLDFSSHALNVTTQFRRVVYASVNSQTCEEPSPFVTINADATPVLSFKTPDGTIVSSTTSYSYCGGTNVEFEASGGRSYEFRVNNVVRFTTSSTAILNPVTFDPLRDASYNLQTFDVVDVIVYGLPLTASNTIDPASCSSESEDVVISITPTPTINIVPSTSGNNFCPGQTVTFTIFMIPADPAATYRYSIGGPMIATGTNTTFGVAMFNRPNVTDNVTITVEVTTGACGTSTQTLFLRENEIINAGTISGSHTICYGEIPLPITSLTTPTVAITSSTISYEWYQSTDLGANWNQIPFEFGTGISITNPVTQTTQYRRRAIVDASGQVCEEDSTPITVTVRAQLIGGTTENLSGNTSETVCLNGTVDTLTVTGSILAPGVTFQWQISDDNFVTWSDVLSATSATYVPSATTSTTYYYRRALISTGATSSVVCNAFSTVFPVYVNDLDEGLLDNTIEGNYCYGSRPPRITSTRDASSSFGVVTYRWEFSIDSGATWTAIVSSNLNEYTPDPLTQSTIFRRMAISDRDGVVCEEPSNEIEFTILTEVRAGTLLTDQTVCEGDIPLGLTINGATPLSASVSYTWQDSTDGINWTDLTSNVTNYNFTALTAPTTNTYYRVKITSNAGTPSITTSENNAILTRTTNPILLGEEYGLYIDGTLYSTTITAGSSSTDDIGQSIANAITLDPVYNAFYFADTNIINIQPYTPNVSIFRTSSTTLSHRIKVLSSIDPQNVCETFTAPVLITVNEDPLISQVAGPFATQNICPGDNMLPIEFEVTGTYSAVVVQGLANAFTVTPLPVGTGTATVISGGGTPNTSWWRVSGTDRFRISGPAGATILTRNSFSIETEGSCLPHADFDYDLLVQPPPEKPDVIMKDFYDTDYAVVSDTLNLWYNNTVCQDTGGGQSNTFYACYIDNGLNLDYNEFDWDIDAGAGSIVLNSRQVAEILLTTTVSTFTVAEAYEIEIDGVTYTVTSTGAINTLDDLGTAFENAITLTATTVTADYNTASNTLTIESVGTGGGTYPPTPLFNINVTNPPGSEASLRNPVISYPTQSATVNWDPLFGTVTNTATLRVRARGCGGSYSDWHAVQIWVVRDDVPATPVANVRPPVALPDLILCDGERPGDVPTCQLLGTEPPTQFFSTAITTNTNNFASLEWRLTNIVNLNPDQTPTTPPGVIDATTGVVSWTRGFYGSFDVEVRAIGCDGSTSSWQSQNYVIGERDSTIPDIIPTTAGTLLGLPVCPIPLTGVTTTSLLSNINVDWYVQSNPGALRFGGGFNTYDDAITRRLTPNSDGTLTLYWQPGFNGTFIVEARPTPCPGPSRFFAINIPAPAQITLDPSGGNNLQTICEGVNINPILYDIEGAANSVNITGLPSGISAIYSSSSQIVTYTLTASTTIISDTTHTISVDFNDYSYTTTSSESVDTVGLALANRLAASLSLSSAVYYPATDELVLTGNNGIRFLTSASFVAGSGFAISAPDNTPLSASLRLSGSPDTTNTAGNYNYVIETVSAACDVVSVTGRITIFESSSITGGVGFNQYQTICFNTPLPLMTLNMSNTFNAVVTGLPPGINYSVLGNRIEIFGTPTVNPAADITYTYSATTFGNINGCAEDTLVGYITVQPAPVINLESAAGTATQTTCAGTAIVSIVYNVSNPAYLLSPTVGSVFPAGVTGVNESRQQITVVTIGPGDNGGPPYNRDYVLDIGGTRYSTGATNTTAVSDIVDDLTAQINLDVLNGVTASPTASTIVITSGTPGIPFDVLDFSTGTGFDVDTNVTQSPARFVISGTISATSVSATTSFIYTLQTVGGTCTGAASPVSGSITVRPSTVAVLLTAGSTTQTTYQTVCDGTPINPLEWEVVGATGINSAPTNPTWLNANYDIATNRFTLSGTPSTGDIYQNIYNYSYSMIGSTFGCSTSTPTIQGTVVVNPAQILRLDSAVGTDAQIVCEGDVLTDPIEYEFLGSAVGYNITPLPTGFTTTLTPRTTIKEITVSPRLLGYTALATETYSLRLVIGGSLSTMVATNIMNLDDADDVGTKMAAIVNTNPDVTATYNTASGTIVVTANTPGTIFTLNNTPNNETNNIQFSTPRDISSPGRLVINGGPAASVVSGVYNYSITTTGANCSPVTLVGSIQVGSDSTLQLKSAPSTTNQTLCDGEPITDIVYEIGGGATNAIATGLPDGLTPTFDAATNEITITGTVTTDNWSDQIFSYTVSTQGNVTFCDEASLNGTIRVNARDYISTVSTFTNLTVCSGDTVSNPLVFDYWGSAGIAANVLNLPPGMYRVNTQQRQVASVSMGALGATSNVSDTYTITVNTTDYTYTTVANETPNDIASKIAALIASDTLSIVSATASSNLIVLTGNTSGTSISISSSKGITSSLIQGPPVMIQGPNRIEILGTPTVPGTYAYSIETYNTICANSASVTGQILVSDGTTITQTQSASLYSQTVCDGTAIQTINYATNGSTGANITGLPDGVNFSATTSTISISGTPTVGNWNVRTYSYEIQTIGNIFGCDEATEIDTITVDPNDFISEITTNTNLTICEGEPIVSIRFGYWGKTGINLIASGLPPNMGSTYSIQRQQASIDFTLGNSAVNDEYTVSINSISFTHSSSVIETGTAVANAIRTLINSNTLIGVTASVSGTELVLTANVSGTTFALDTTSNIGASLTLGTPQMIQPPRVLELSGVPTGNGIFNYNVRTVGGACNSTSVTRTITINPSTQITRISSASTFNQNVCNGTSISTITYTYNFGTINIDTNDLPLGVNATFLSTNTLQITGTPSTTDWIQRTYTYQISSTGNIYGCADVLISDSIVITPNDYLTLTSTDSVVDICEGDAIPEISFEYWGAPGITAYATGLPSGVNPQISLNRQVASIDFGSVGDAMSIGDYITLAVNNNTYTYSSTTNLAIDDVVTWFVAQVNADTTLNVSAVASATDTEIEFTADNAGVVFGLLTTTNPGSSLVPNSPRMITGPRAITLTGTPTAAGIYNYNVRTDSTSCTSMLISGTINVIGDASLILTSSPTTEDQTVCEGDGIEPIVYAIGGGGSANVYGLTGLGLNVAVTSSTITISGTPTLDVEVPTAIRYSVQTTGTLGICDEGIRNGFIVIWPNEQLNIIGAIGTVQVCQRSFLPPINLEYRSSGEPSVLSPTISINGGGLIATSTASSPQVMEVTLSGAPTSAGEQYQISINGIPFTASSTTTGTTLIQIAQELETKLAASPLVSVVRAANVLTITGNTNALFELRTISDQTGVQLDVTDSTPNIGTFTITGTPTVMDAPGIHNLLITTPGGAQGCLTAQQTITIDIVSASQISLSSSPSGMPLTVCDGTVLGGTPSDTLEYLITGGAVNANITWAGGTPAWVSSNLRLNDPSTGSHTFEIFSGAIDTRSRSVETFNYVITTTGNVNGCSEDTVSGTLIVNPKNYIDHITGTGSVSQLICESNTPATFSPIGFRLDGSATSASISWTLGVPPGLTFNQSGTLDYYISGSIPPSSIASDVVYLYEITASGGCAPVTITGSITILANPEIILTSPSSYTSQVGATALCENTDILPIEYTLFGGADRAEITWLTSTVIDGISVNVVSSTAGTPSGTLTFIEISGTASMSEIVATRFPYEITAFDDDAGCTPVASLYGVIEILPAPTVMDQFIRDNDITDVTCHGGLDGSIIIPATPESEFQKRIFGGQQSQRERQRVTWVFNPGTPNILDRIGVTIDGIFFEYIFQETFAGSGVPESLTDGLNGLVDKINNATGANDVAVTAGIGVDTDVIPPTPAITLVADVPGVSFTVNDPPYSYTPSNTGTVGIVTTTFANVVLNYQFNWYDSDIASTPFATGLELRNMTAGSYWFEVVINTCESGRYEFVIDEPDAPLSVDLATCRSTQTEGIIDVEIAGGTPPYTLYLYREVTSLSTLTLVQQFVVSGSASGTSHTYTGLQPQANYTVEVIDDTGVCFDTENAFLNGGLTVDWSAIEATVVNDSCLESPADIGDGSISVTSAQATNLITGGSGSFVYTWEGQTSVGTRTYNGPDINGLIPGAYTLTIFDQVYLCDTSYTFIVQGPPALNVVVDPTLTSPRELTWYPKPITGAASTTSASSTTTSGTAFTINELIYLDCVSTTADMAIQVSGAVSSSASSLTTNPIYTVQWYKDGVTSGAPGSNTEVLAGQGPGIYFAEVTTAPGCSERYYFEIREPEPFSVVLDKGRTIQAGCPGDTATLYFNIVGGKQSPYQTVNYTLSIAGGIYTGSATSGNKTVIIQNVDPAVLSTGSPIPVELSDDLGCTPFTTTISFTLDVPEPVVVGNVDVVDIDCSIGQLGAITLSLDGYTGDLTQLEVKWTGTSITLPAGAPPTYRYERFVPFVPATNTRAENGRTVGNGEVYDLIYPGEYTYEIRRVSQAASGTSAQICTELAVGTVVINSVGNTQLTMQPPTTQQGGCSGQTGGAITLNIDMATVVPPLEVSWYRSQNVRRAVVADNASSTNASGTTSSSTVEPEYELVQQWVEVPEFRGQLTAFNLENGLYKATINDQRGPGSGQCPSGAIETSVITIFDEGIELLNPTVTENYNPEFCGDAANAVEGTFRFSIRDNIINSTSNDIDIELIGRSGGIIYSNTGAGSGTTVVSQFGNGNPRVGNSYQFVQLPPDEYDLLVSKAGSVSNVVCQETYSFTIYQYQPMEYLGDQTFLVDECLGYAEVSALVEGGLPYVVDGNAVYQYNWTLNVKEGDTYTGEVITFVGEQIRVYNEGDLSLIVYDSNGCTLELDGTTLPQLSVEFETDPFRIVPTQEDDNGDLVFALPPDCGNDAENGSIGFRVEGGKPPYNIEWYIEDPLAGRTEEPHRGYRKMDIENTTFSSGLTPGNYKIVIQPLVNTCPNVEETIFEQNIVVPLNKDLYIIDGPYVDEDLCKQLPGRIVVDVFDNLQGDLTFYYNNILVDTEVNRISDRTFTLLIPQPVPDAELRIVNEEGCSITSDIILGVGDPNFEYTSVNFEASGSVLAREQVTFENTSTDPFSVSEWVWGDNTPSEFVYVRSESVSPTRHEFGISGTYFTTLRIYNDIGCSEEITKPIVVGKGYNILVPNVFSPNGDLVNDNFKPLFSGFSLVEFTIYDNRGNKVYYEITPGDGIPIEPENYTVPLELNGWDGSNSGNSPYYIYTVRGITLFGEKEIERSGTFIILR